MEDLPRDDDRKQEILDFIVDILRDIAGDNDFDEISAQTPLGSIVYESINLVYLIGDLQTEYKLEDLLVQKLRAAKINIQHLCVADMVNLVWEVLASSNVSVHRGERERRQY
jgi:hypothetical protein